MSTLFDDLCIGIQEAINFEKGKGVAKKVTYRIQPVKKFTHEEIRRIRLNAGMTQSVLASYMGVSKKTVEAWECGRTRPRGPACRLLDLLASEEVQGLSFITKGS